MLKVASIGHENIKIDGQKYDGDLFILGRYVYSY